MAGGKKCCTKGNKKDQKAPQKEACYAPTKRVRPIKADCTTAPPLNIAAECNSVPPHLKVQISSGPINSNASPEKLRATKRRRSLRLIGKEMSEPCYKTPKKPSLECDEKPEEMREAEGKEKEDVAVASSVPPGIIDIDVGGHEDLMEFKVYAKEYYDDYLRSRETIGAPHPQEIDSMQKDVTPKMRAILVDWLVEVCAVYKLMPSTLYQCVDLVDRSLSRFTVNAKKDLQCLGAACLFIASKFEEVSPPAITDFVHMADDAFTRRQLLLMEKKIVSKLGFNVHSINVYSFLKRFWRAAGSKGREVELVNYLCELMLLDYHFITYPPSMRAAASLNLARQTLCRADRQVWTPTIKYYTGYSEQELEPCVRALHRAQINAEYSELRTIRQKYETSKRHHVADITCLTEEALSFSS